MSILKEPIYRIPTTFKGTFEQFETLKKYLLNPLEEFVVLKSSKNLESHIYLEQNNYIQRTQENDKTVRFRLDHRV